MWMRTHMTWVTAIALLVLRTGKLKMANLHKKQYDYLQAEYGFFTSSLRGAHTHVVTAMEDQVPGD